MKVSNLFLAISLAISSAPAWAGGSMAPEVRVIVVNPSATIRRIDSMRQMERDKRAAERAETKRRLEEGRALVKRMEQAARDYTKKMEAARKAAAKKRK